MTTCLECGTEIFGRPDKKFCSDLCRNAYNNKLNRADVNAIRNINYRLRKNWRILGELCADDKVKIAKEKLLSLGFDFKYHTHLRTTQKGATYFFVYDYGYLELENDYFLVVKDNKTEPKM